MEFGNGFTTSPTLLSELYDHEKGDTAWRTFLGRYEPMIYSWCRRAGLPHDQAEEVGNAVLARLAVTLREFEYDPSKRFRGWLKTVVDNAVRGHWRQRKRRPGDHGRGNFGVEDPLDAAAARADSESLSRDLCEALSEDIEEAAFVTARVRARVRPHAWQAFWSTAIEGREALAVAEELGMSIAAVYVAKSKVGKIAPRGGGGDATIGRRPTRRGS